MNSKITFIIALFITLQSTGRNLDSLTVVLNSSTDIEELAKTNIEIGKYYIGLRQDTAMFFLAKGAELANEISDKTLMATAYMGVTEYLRFVKEDNEKAYFMAQEATELIRSAGDEPELLTKYQGMTYTYGGTYQLQLGNYTEAQELFLKAVGEIEKVNQPRALVSIKHQLFVVYYSQSMYAEAEEIINECIDLCIENNWYHEHRTFLTNKAALLTAREKPAESIAVLRETMQLMRDNNDLNNHGSLGILMNNIGFNFFELGAHDSSYAYHKRGLEYGRSISNPGGLVGSYTSLCQDCAVLGKHDLAKSYCDSMQVGLGSLNRTNLKENALVAWIHYYTETGNLEEAMTKMEELMEFNKEKINEENVREQTAQKMEYEFEKERLISEKEIELKNENIAAEKAYSENLRLVLLLLGGLLALLVFLLYSNFKKRKIISNQNEKLNHSIEEKETLLKEIHHRVKNNLQLVSSLLSLQSENIDNDKINSIFEEGQNRVQAMALIHQKLYQNDVASEIDFEDYLKGLAGHFEAIGSTDKKVEFEFNCNNVKLDIDTAIPLGLIINELFTNSYKHAFTHTESPQLSVSIEDDGNGEYTMKMTDNGLGLPPDLDWSKAKTLGLRLIRSLVKQLIGKIDYQHRENLSIFSIQFKSQLGRNLLD